MTPFLSAEAIALRGKLFRGLADPSRLAILEVLRQGACTVSEIVVATGLTQPNVSNHLSCLRDCGLVTSIPQGRSVRYQLSDERVASLMSLADTLVAEVARGIYECTRYTRETQRDGDLGNG
jgi:ArsR family transcriptional regulator, cadmium/lead-responsive transcriptional repressor